MECSDSMHSFGLFPRAPRFLPQRIAGSGYEIAPTGGVAAININGTTINTALAIPKESGDNLPAMSDQRKLNSDYHFLV